MTEITISDSREGGRLRLPLIGWAFKEAFFELVDGALEVPTGMTNDDEVCTKIQP